jgi:hypothetical protein
MSPREKDLTYNLIHRLGNKSTAHLLYHQGALRSIGNKIDHIPPLQFLSFIVTHPELKPALRLLLDRMITRSNFIDGASEKLIAQKKSGRLLREIEGFCNYINKEYSRVEIYCKQEQWAQFIDYIAE